MGTRGREGEREGEGECPCSSGPIIWGHTGSHTAVYSCIAKTHETIAARGRKSGVLATYM